MKIITLLCFLIIFIVANILLKPKDNLVKPSEFYVNTLVSGGVWYYKRRVPVDYLILGNSRAKDGLDPAIIEAKLHKKVHIISSGGGYFPFYYNLLRSTMKNELPKNIILSLSPRDFNKKEIRLHKVSSYLVSSYGYKLDGRPYNYAFKLMEKGLTDLLASVFPILYYTSHIKDVVFNYSANATIFDEPFVDFIDRYTSGIANVFRDSWLATDVVRQDGYQVPIAYTPKEYEQRSRHNKENWEQIIKSKDYDKYRTSPYCDGLVELETRESSYLHQTFKFLEANNIGVYIVQLPAIWFEGCENNLKFGESITNYLKTLKTTYTNIKSVIDLNKNFSHDFKNQDIYADLEHLYPKNAKLFSEPVAERIMNDAQ